MCFQKYDEEYEYKRGDKERDSVSDLQLKSFRCILCTVYLDVNDTFPSLSIDKFFGVPERHLTGIRCDLSV